MLMSRSKVKGIQPTAQVGHQMQFDAGQFKVLPSPES